SLRRSCVRPPRLSTRCSSPSPTRDSPKRRPCTSSASRWPPRSREASPMAERRPRKTAPRVTVPEKLTPADRAKFGVHEAQAEAEGVELPFDDKVDFMGAQFKMAQSIGLWPLIAFSMAQKRGDNVDPKSLA